MTLLKKKNWVYFIGENELINEFLLVEIIAEKSVFFLVPLWDIDVECNTMNSLFLFVHLY